MKTSRFFSMRPIMNLLAHAFVAILVGAGGAGATPEPGSVPRPNVLLIMVDDLNTWTGPEEGHPQAHTPNLDRLAQRGVTFKRAYAAAPLCGPSRAAILYGLQPFVTGFYGHQAGHDPRGLIDASVVPLPLAFQQAGYATAGCGKIFHLGFEDDRGWDEFVRDVPSRESEGDDHDVIHEPFDFGPLDDVTDDDMNDMQLANWAAERLRSPGDRPFFLAVGFRKPHLPWTVPRSYFDVHPREKIHLPPSPEDDLDDVPPIGRYLASPGVSFSAPAGGDYRYIQQHDQWVDAVRAYLATCSFVDACVGRVMEALDRSEARDNTIIILMGDHGWHLGEKQHWRKHALWEQATRTTLIVALPRSDRAGVRCDRVVSLIDTYATLSELCGLTEKPDAGKSFVPLLRTPSRAWDYAAVSTFGPGNFSVRTESWSYLRYREGSEELYYHGDDPQEYRNLAGEPAFAEQKAELASRLPEMWAADPAPDSKFNALRQFDRMSK